MTPLESFAEQARSFQRWIQDSRSQGGALAREALFELTALYVAALRLPSPFLEPSDSEAADRVDDQEFKKVFKWGARLPFNYYGEVFDSTVVPPEEPVVGDLADDVADIYRDVITGLRLFEDGRFNDASWEWGFTFQSHWGKHATDAIRAIHYWLASNEPERLHS